jgi:hypothetical protein
MSQRARVVVLLVVTVVVLGLTAGYFVWSAGHDDQSGSRAAPARVPVDELADRPRIVFRNTAIGPEYGRVAMVALADPAGPRAVTRTACDRVDAVQDTTLCLRAVSGITSTYEVIAQRDGSELFDLERPGVPSRARLSPDGTMSASTAFVGGDSYLTAGFSTRTYITSLPTGRGLHVEDFALTHHGRRVAPVERNYWGVTFVDDDTFYVTVSFGGDTWLARGSVRDRTVETIRDAAECPSVSPDHTRVAYKKRQGSGGWRVAVLDLASRQETLLPERRSVDDQVAWLDDDTVLYALPLTGRLGGESDVWAMAADGSSRPRLLIKQAASPAVVRVSR